MKTEIEMETKTCVTCGVLFAVSKEHKDYLKQFGTELFCPNGHRQQYLNSLPDKFNELQRDYEKLKIELDATMKNFIEEKTKKERLQKSIDGYKGQNTKLHNRIKKLTKNKK